jgi:hypothetical protein
LPSPFVLSEAPFKVFSMTRSATKWNAFAPWWCGECENGLVDHPTIPNAQVACRCRDAALRKAKLKRLVSTIPNEMRGIRESQPEVMDMPATTRERIKLFVRRTKARVEAERKAPPIREEVDTREPYPAGELGLFLRGPIGSGKTHAAGWATQALLDADVDVYWETLTRMLRRFKQTYGEGSDVLEAELLKTAAEVDVLVIDDLGAARQTPWMLELVGQVIDDRYVARKPIIVTCDLTMQEVDDHLGRRVVDRLEGMCGVPIEFTGRDGRSFRKLSVYGDGPTGVDGRPVPEPAAITPPL